MHSMPELSTGGRGLHVHSFAPQQIKQSSAKQDCVFSFKHFVFNFIQIVQIMQVVLQASFIERTCIPTVIEPFIPADGKLNTSHSV